MDGLKKKRDKFLTELKELAKQRRREPELQNLQSQIDGLDTRLRYCRKDRDAIVSIAFFSFHLFDDHEIQFLLFYGFFFRVKKTYPIRLQLCWSHLKLYFVIDALMENIQ